MSDTDKPNQLDEVNKRFLINDQRWSFMKNHYMMQGQQNIRNEQMLRTLNWRLRLNWKCICTMATELVMKHSRIMTILASDSIVNIVYIFICEKRRVWQPSSQDSIYKPLTTACSWILLIVFIKHFIKRLLLQVK